nr:hypothetical protein [uncultured Carboxylicivirga sp.]
MSKLLKLLLPSLLLSTITLAQPVPGVDENIPNLVTFGSEGETYWGDDNFCQIIFFAVPENFNKPIYLRVFDPDTGGDNDEIQGEWNTKTRISVYGGKGSCSNQDARDGNLNGDYDSGAELDSKFFENNPEFNLKWYTFGPYNPSEGEYLPEDGGYIFKIIIEGTEGDDGNMYRLFLSSNSNENHEVEGAFAYYFKYKFRMHDDITQVSHIYPYINDTSTVYIKQSNFDWDNDGMILVRSVDRPGTPMNVSVDDNWIDSNFKIREKEYFSSLDIRMIKNKNAKIINNNVVIRLENQDGEGIKLYSIPIGGVPKYIPKPTHRKVNAQ